MANSADIVGYTYKADNYCPEHIMERVYKDHDGWELAAGIHMDVEADLNEIAAAFGVTRYDESSFDTDDFPKVVFRDQAGYAYCAADGMPLT